MTALLRLSAGTFLALSLSACAMVESGGVGDTDMTASGSHGAMGSKGVTPEQAEWLARGHARPAGR